VFGVTKKGKDYYLLIEKNKWPNRQGDIISEVIVSEKINFDGTINLRVKAVGDTYEFFYSTGGSAYQNFGGKLSGDILSTDVAGGFTGCLLGLYATSGNDALPE
jgi:alpha-N-arabinofuranosidase